jgi:hypothetical protein
MIAGGERRRRREGFGDRVDGVPAPGYRAGHRALMPVGNARLMDRARILASLRFPSFPRLCGQTFYEGKELGELCVRAYNDFMIDEWCGSAPGR